MSRLLGVAVLSLLVSVSGCGGSGATGGVPVYTVTGTVKMAGAPLADATVIFAPTNEQPTATGRTDEDGAFSLTTYSYGDGAAEGKFKVLVSKTITAESSDDDSGHGDDYEASDSHSGSNAADEAQMVPPNYGSKDDTPLNVEVKKDGDNNFDFEIL